MKRTLRQRLRFVGRYIPGFRHPSQTSIAVAITYYAAALAVAAVHWPWGIALLAAPFFFFALADLGHGHSRRAAITAGVAAACMLLCIALGLGAEDYRLKPPLAHPVLAQSNGAAGAIAIKPTATPTADAPTADPQALLFVASKSGKVFHRPDCASAKNIKTENRVQFSTRAEAIAAGLKPCQKCKP